MSDSPPIRSAEPQLVRKTPSAGAIPSFGDDVEVERSGGPLVEVSNVTKRFGAVTALNDVSMTLHRGEIHALCGHNGAGKSTLIKMLAGLQTPDSGEILLDGQPDRLSSPVSAQLAGVAIVDQELAILPELSVAENLFLGEARAPFLTRRAEQRRRAVELLARVGLSAIDPVSRAGNYSLGVRQRIEIARALGRDARLLVLDEPTATLGEVEIQSVFEAVREAARAGTTVVFVSHRIGEVLELCERVTVMRDGKVVANREVDELTSAQLVNLLVGDLPEKALRPAALALDEPPVVSIRDLSVPPRVEDFTLELRRGEVVALAGQVGAGANDILRALAGLVPAATGSLEIEGRAVSLRDPGRVLPRGVVFISNDRKSEGVFLRHSVLSNLMALRLDRFSGRRTGILQSRRARKAGTELASTIGLEKRLDSRVDELSGGNQQKVFIGRSLGLEHSRLILLDEPTRGVDVAGRADIHGLIRASAASGNAVILSSTELDEILDVADTVVTLYKGTVVSARARSTVTADQVLAEMTHATRDEAS